MEEFYFYTEGLTVGYHGIPLIKNIKIQLKRGEILTLIGPNGAGKTTILKSIIRQLEPLGGVAVLDGRRMGEMTGKELSRKLSVVLTGKEDHRMVREAMELVHIEELEERDFSKTSDGQKQRVMLARAICQEPDIIVLDEPTSFLDIRYKLEFLSILQNMSRRRKLSVIMSLHELDLAERISHQIVCVRGDKVERFGPPEEIFTPGYIPELYEITAGSFEPLTGSLELEPIKGPPEVFVLAGNGSGTPVYRSLQRAGIPFATGILWENDLDYPAARALASAVIAVPPFSAAEEEVILRAQKQLDACREVVWENGGILCGGFWSMQKSKGKL